MPTLADYHVLADQNVIKVNSFLQIASDQELPDSQKGEGFFRSFDPPDDIRLDDDPISRPLLCYRVDTEDNANDLRYEILIRNDTGKRTVGGLILSDSILRTIVEPIESSSVRKGSNKIIFQYKSGTGTLVFSKVVIWFKRKV